MTSTDVMTNLDRAQDLCQMTGMGQLKEAIDKYYADDVTIIEANGDTFTGKETQKGRVDEWQAGLEAMHDGGVYAVTSNEDTGVTMIESWVDVTFKQGGRMKFEEVAVQTWVDGKITRERFYYNMPG